MDQRRTRQKQAGIWLILAVMCTISAVIGFQRQRRIVQGREAVENAQDRQALPVESLSDPRAVPEPSGAPPEPTSPTDVDSAVSPSAARAVRLKSLVLLTDLVKERLLIANRAGPPNLPYTLDPNWDLDPRFPRLFALSDSELTALEREIAAVKTTVSARVMASSTVRRATEAEIAALNQVQARNPFGRAASIGSGDEAYELVIAPASGAAELRDRFIAALRDILGPERYEAFAVLNGQQAGPRGMVSGGPPDFFGAYGGQGANVTIAKINGRYVYKVGPGAEGGRGPSLGAGFAGNLDSLRQAIGAAVDMLPAGF